MLCSCNFAQFLFVRIVIFACFGVFFTFFSLCIGIEITMKKIIVKLMLSSCVDFLVFF